MVAEYVFASLLLARFPYFEKMKAGLCDLHVVCVSVNSPTPAPLTFEYLNQLLRNLVCITWQLDRSQRRTS
jgi:hypothetical protein